MSQSRFQTAWLCPGAGLSGVTDRGIVLFVRGLLPRLNILLILQKYYVWRANVAAVRVKSSKLNFLEK